MASRQLPVAGEVFLDHVAHFVGDIETAGTVLTRLGFRLTSLTAQLNHTPEGPVPAGMANRCVMLRQGYVEFLTAVSDTELARHFRAALQRYGGLHLLAMSTAEPSAAYSRLVREGFAPEPAVHLRRPVELADGTPAEAQFTVLRVSPEVMPEGRIQLVTHHSEETVWQRRWLDHPNGVVSLEAALLVVDDPQEVAGRFGRFAGRACKRCQSGRWQLPLDRGRIVFADMSAMASLVPWVGPPPSRPYIAGYALGSFDPSLTQANFAKAGVEASNIGAGEASYCLPSALGGFATVLSVGTLPSWCGRSIGTM